MLRPLYIVGPTGSGKSALAVEFATQANGEIINADAFQIYDGLAILTAQPSPDETSQAPHHLYGFLPVSETFDAAQYASRAQAKISEIQSRGKLPIIVGGSGMYVKALTHGLSDMPPVDPALRAELAALPLEILVPRLLKLDPGAHHHVSLQNPRHVQRALEICLLTGQPASLLKQTWRQSVSDSQGIFLNPDRDKLYVQINQRTHAMLAAGVIEAVRALTPMSKTATQAIGVREILSDLSESEIASAMQQATRRYAKRQVTWFKRESCFQAASTTSQALEMLLSYASSGIHRIGIM